MFYKGIEVNADKLSVPYSLNDVPESVLGRYSDTLPRKSSEDTLSYRQRVVNYLNNLRLRISSTAASLKHNLDKQELRSVNFNATPGRGQFQEYDTSRFNLEDAVGYLRPQVKGIRYGGPRVFTSLDIETDDNGYPITISALKQIYNVSTGKFETIGNFQRFYHANNRDLKESSLIHGLTSQKLKRLRGQQGHRELSDGSINTLRYSNKYNEAEAEALKKFLDSSIIVGHNIIDFDLPHLFNKPLNNQTIDTLFASRNQWPGRKNDLASVFQRLYGKSMEQAGLSHHDSMSDVIATALIAQKMLSFKGTTGDALRYVATTPATHIAPLDTYIESQVIKGLYNQYKQTERYIDMKDYDGTEISIEELMGAKEEIDRPINKDTKKPTLPNNMHYIDPIEDGDIVSDISLFTTSLSEVGKQIQSAAETNGVFAQDMSKVFTAMRNDDIRKVRLKAARLNTEDERKKYLKGLGYGDNEINDVLRGTRELHEVLKDDREKSYIRAQERLLDKELWKAKKRGDDSSISVLESARGTTVEEIWDAIDYNRKRASSEKDTEKRDSNYLQFKIDRDAKISKLLRHGRISESQAEQLKLTSSYGELDEAMDSVLLKNGKLLQIFEAISRIPMYNFEKIEQVFKGEVGGIMGSARGVIPDFLYSPFSRAVNAGMNSLNTWSAPGKAMYRIGGAVSNTLMGIGSALTTGGGLAALSGGLTAAGAATAATGAGIVPGLIMMGVGGTIGLGSQIAGNVWEANITRKGEDIQNMFNSIGMIKEIILMPLRLFASAIKLAVKGLHTLSGVLKGFAGLMTSGLAGTIQMGNPLSVLTGTTYGDYYSSKLIDIATLQSPGTVNGMLENFAVQQQQLYTTGRLDTNRLVAASMLGVFNEVYGPTDNWNTSMKSMINKLAGGMKGQSSSQKQFIMALANAINPGTGAILQTMDTFGITDYDKLKRPKGIFMRSEEAISGWRSGWQRAQWEYQAAGAQFGVSKNRIGTSLWGKIGKPVFNTVNTIADAIANAMGSGQWENIIGIVKEGAKNLWGTLKTTFGIKNEASLFGNIKNSVLEGAAQLIELLRDKVLPKIYSVWDMITSCIIDKTTDLVSFLSTIRIDWKALKDMIFTGKSDKPWITSILDTKATDDKAYSLDYIKRGSRGLQKLAYDYDMRHPSHPGTLVQSEFGGEIVRGIPYANISEKRGKFRTNQDYIEWIASKLKYGTPEDIAELDSLFKSELGYEDLIKTNTPLIYPGADAEEIVEYIVQRQKYGAVGANWVHRQYKNLEMSKEATFNQALRKAKEDTDPYVNSIVDGVLTSSAETLRSWKTPIMEIDMTDKNGDKATAQVMTDGSVSLVNNSNVGITVRDGIPQFFRQNATRMIGG